MIHITSRWAYALRTELGDGAGEEAIRDTINHLVSNLTSEQWAKDRLLLKFKAKMIFLTDLSKSKMIRQSTMQNIMGQSFTHLRYNCCKCLYQKLSAKKGGTIFFKKDCVGPWHGPCERHRSERGRGFSDEHSKPLLWIAHHVTKVQNLSFASLQIFFCISNLFLGLVFFSTTRWTTSQRQTSPTILGFHQAPTISSGLEKIFLSCVPLFLSF